MILKKRVLIIFSSICGLLLFFQNCGNINLTGPASSPTQELPLVVIEPTAPPSAPPPPSEGPTSWPADTETYTSKPKDPIPSSGFESWACNQAYSGGLGFWPLNPGKQIQWNDKNFEVQVVRFVTSSVTCTATEIGPLEAGKNYSYRYGDRTGVLAFRLQIPDGMYSLNITFGAQNVVGTYFYPSSLSKIAGEINPNKPNDENYCFSATTGLGAMVARQDGAQKTNCRVRPGEVYYFNYINPDQFPDDGYIRRVILSYRLTALDCAKPNWQTKYVCPN